MNKTEVAQKRPFWVVVVCKDLIGVEVKGQVFVEGIYFSLTETTDHREALAIALGHISEITGIGIKSLNCKTFTSREVSAEEAEIMIKYLKNARSEDEIEFR